MRNAPRDDRWAKQAAMLAQAAINVSDYPLAESLSAAALDVGTKGTESRKLLVHALYEQGKYDACLRASEKALELESLGPDVEVYFRKLAMYSAFRLGRLEDIKRHARLLEEKGFQRVDPTLGDWTNEVTEPNWKRLLRRAFDPPNESTD